MEEKKGYRNEAAHEGDFEFEIEYFTLFGVGASSPGTAQGGNSVVVEKDESDERHDKL